MAVPMAQLDSLIQLPFAAGSTVITADLHMVSWMGHLLVVTGNTDPADVEAPENHTRKAARESSIGCELRG